jgi:hypothetical protein
MPKTRPKTGEPRETHQPLKIDRLPSAVHDAIVFLYTVAGKSWMQIEEQSALPYDAEWQRKGGGFVNWHDLPLSVLELFPDLRLPKSNLHRWFDLRIAQVRKTTLDRAEQARVMAEAFADAKVEGDADAVLFAARDIFFGLLTEDGSLAARAAAGKALLELAKQQQKSRTNDIRERQVAVEEKRVEQLVKDAERRRRLMDEEADKLKKKSTKGKVTPEDVDRLRERVFGLPPKVKGEADAEAV